MLTLIKRACAWGHGRSRAQAPYSNSTFRSRSFGLSPRCRSALQSFRFVGGYACTRWRNSALKQAARCRFPVLASRSHPQLCDNTNC